MFACSRIQSVDNGHSACATIRLHGYPTSDESGDDVVQLVDHPQRLGIDGPRVKAGGRDRTSLGGGALFLCLVRVGWKGVRHGKNRKYFMNVKNGIEIT